MYPILEIHLDKIKENMTRIKDVLVENNISLTAVIKGCAGAKPVVEAYLNSGCTSIGSSRIQQLKELKHVSGIERMLLRLPMLDEISDVIEYTEVSLNSELETLKALNDEAIKRHKIHQVILMLDVGDLREGFWDENALIEAANFVERTSGLHLKGIGCNLSCYGSVMPTSRNLKMLIEVAETVEVNIDRTLEIISGGATSTMPLVLDHSLPKRINHLRLGEAILIGRDLNEFYNCNMLLNTDTFILRASLIEIKEKPSYPIGEQKVDAFGNLPYYHDIGYHKRGILAIGKLDFGDHNKLIPTDEYIKIIGSSSDHLIVDLSKTTYQLGDVLSFEMFYQSMLFLSHDDEVEKVYVEKT